MVGLDEISAIIQGHNYLLIGTVMRLQNDKRVGDTLRCKQFLN